MTFEENYFSCCILLPDQVSFSGCLYLVGHWVICVLPLLVNQVKTSKIWKLTLHF